MLTMFNRIKAGVTAVAAIMSSFLWASCDRFWDDNPRKFGPSTYGPIFEDVPFFGEKDLSELSDYCKKYHGNNDFYACLCEKSIKRYSIANYERDDDDDYDPRIGTNQNIGNKFEKYIKFAEQNCCQDLKPDEMNKNPHYCDVPAIACNLPPVDSKCEEYSECIYDVLVRKDGKDRCKTDDSDPSEDTETKPEEQPEE